MPIFPLTNTIPLQTMAFEKMGVEKPFGVLIASLVDMVGRVDMRMFRSCGCYGRLDD